MGCCGDARPEPERAPATGNDLRDQADAGRAVRRLSALHEGRRRDRAAGSREAERIIATAIHLVGDEEEGTAMAITAFTERGAPPGEAPSGTLTEVLRVCAEYASELNIDVSDLSRAVYVYAPRTERSGT